MDLSIKLSQEDYIWFDDKYFEIALFLDDANKLKDKYKQIKLEITSDDAFQMLSIFLFEILMCWIRVRELDKDSKQRFGQVIDEFDIEIKIISTKIKSLYFEWFLLEIERETY